MKYDSTIINKSTQINKYVTKHFCNMHASKPSKMCMLPNCVFYTLHKKLVVSPLPAKKHCKKMLL